MLRRDRDAGDQAATADRHHDRLERGHGGEHLQRDRALAADDALVVVRVHDREAVLARVLERRGLRLVEGFAGEDHLDAVLARALHLHVRGEARHEDRGADAEPLRVVSDCLRVVAGGDRQHARLALDRAQAQELVERPALLEGPGELEVLELEEDLGARHLGERARGEAGRLLYRAGDRRGGLADALRGDGHQNGFTTARITAAARSTTGTSLNQRYHTWVRRLRSCLKSAASFPHQRW